MSRIIGDGNNIGFNRGDMPDLRIMINLNTSETEISIELGVKACQI